MKMDSTKALDMLALAASGGTVRYADLLRQDCAVARGLKEQGMIELEDKLLREVVVRLTPKGLAELEAGA